MDYLSEVLAFIGGVSMVAITATINTKINEKSEAEKKLADAEYEFFIRLNNLYNWYFWLASNELHGQETSKDTIVQINDIATDLAKLLHENEKSEFAEELLKILYDESYETYNDRWKHMAELSSKIGKKVSPVHHKYSKSLSESNIKLMAKEGFVSKAPASGRFRIGV